MDQAQTNDDAPLLTHSTPQSEQTTLLAQQKPLVTIVHASVGSVHTSFETPPIKTEGSNLGSLAMPRISPLLGSSLKPKVPSAPERLTSFFYGSHAPHLRPDLAIYAYGTSSLGWRNGMVANYVPRLQRIYS